MFKRLLWLTMGTAVGFGASFWVTRAVRHTVARYAPERAVAAARSAAAEVRAALAEGRAAMAAREAELRAQLTPPVGPHG